MVLRPALLLTGLVTAASLAGVWYSVGSKARAQPVPVAKPTATQPTKAADATFQTKILPFLKKYCLECHNADKAAGGLTLDGYQSEEHARKNRKDWGAVQHVMSASEMPPKKKPQPTKEERQFVIDWIAESLTKVDCTAPKDPGRVTVRRLNRAEYDNTIRDLCGVNFKPAEDFPADDVGYGFDNIGDVLSFQPILMEKYLAAADKILETALKIEEPAKSSRQEFRTQNIQVIPRDAKSRERLAVISFQTEGSAFLEKFNFPAEGDYVIRFRGWGSKAGDAFPIATIRVDGKDIKTFAIEAVQGKPQTYEVKARFPSGEKRVSVAFTNPSTEKDASPKRTFGLDRLEIEGPFDPKAPADPASVKLLLTTRPKANATAAENRTAAEKVLSDFARRAYRRPVTAQEIERLMKLFDITTKQGEPFHKAVLLPMKAVLVSPHFLYRIEEDPKNPDDSRTISEYELATRLSYFLWSSMPDEELFSLAEKNQLRKPGVLETQVRRMLQDPKAKSLAQNFGAQWLQLAMLKTLTPDKGYFPDWDDSLKDMMAREAEMYFENIVRNDRSIMEFLDSNYTFVNSRLARHYGIPDVIGIDFREVKLPDNRRGGVLTMGCILTVTSNPTRTSPVKRGKWVLENILGTPPPPPAPDVPELPPTGQLKGTLRQQMEQHRANPNCATCHAKLDPLGFGLENFDAVGAWRTQDNKQPIDASGVLPGGEKFTGPTELRKVLLGKSDQFRRCFAEKLLTFGLGRGLEYYDKCVLDDIVAASKANTDRFSSLVLAIVKSDPFQKRKGKRSE